MYEDRGILESMALLESLVPNVDADHNAGAQPTASETLLQMRSTFGGESLPVQQSSSRSATLCPAAAETLTGVLLTHPAVAIDKLRENHVAVWLESAKASTERELSMEEEAQNNSDEGGAVPITAAADDAMKDCRNRAAHSEVNLHIQNFYEEGVRNAFLFAQQCADELEKERLTAVFPEAAVAQMIEYAEAKASEQFSVRTTAIALPEGGIVPPPRIHFHLLFGPLLRCDVLQLGRRPPSVPCTSTQNVALNAVKRGAGNSNLATIDIPFTSHTVVHSLQRISQNVYDTQAWVALLRECMDLPLSATRSLWQHAVYLFPTCGTIVHSYLSKEIDLLNDVNVAVKFSELNEEREAKSVFRMRLRVLNVYARHLQRCFHTPLFEQYISFLRRHIGVEGAMLKTIYEVSLRKFVGMSYDSTGLWLDYVEWQRTLGGFRGKIIDTTKSLYKQILRTPLDHLANVKAAYESFEKEIGTRNFRGLDKETEKAMHRAMSFAGEMKPLFELMSGTLHIDSSRAPYLPRPFQTPPSELSDEATCLEDTSVDCEERRVEQQQLLAAWTVILRKEIESNYSSTQDESGHYRRVVFLLRVRASYFPHEMTMYHEVAKAMVFGVPKQFVGLGPSCIATRAFVGRDAASKAASYLLDALQLFPLHLNTVLLLADLYRGHLNRSVDGEMLIERAAMTRKETTMYLLAQLKDIVAGSAPAVAEALVTSALRREANLPELCHQFRRYFRDAVTAMVDRVEEIVVLIGNWMDLARQSNPREAAGHLRLVAKYGIEKVEFLALIMSSLRVVNEVQTSFLNVVHQTALQHKHHHGPSFSPESMVALGNALVADSFSSYRFLLPFSSFCSHWIDAELYSLHDVRCANLVLTGWKNWLKATLSTRGQRRSIVDCGLDESFFAAAERVGKAASRQPTTSSTNLCFTEVLEVLNDLVKCIDDTSAAVAQATTSNVPNLNMREVGEGVMQRRWAVRTAQAIDPTGVEVRQRSVELLPSSHGMSIDSIGPLRLESDGTLGADRLALQHASMWANGFDAIDHSNQIFSVYGVMPLPTLDTPLFHCQRKHTDVRADWLTQDGTPRLFAEALVSASCRDSFEKSESAVYDAEKPLPDASLYAPFTVPERPKRIPSQRPAETTTAAEAESSEDDDDGDADAVVARVAIPSKAPIARRASMNLVNRISTNVEATGGLDFCLDKIRAARVLEKLHIAAEEDLKRARENRGTPRAPPRNRRRTEPQQGNRGDEALLYGRSGRLLSADQVACNVLWSKDHSLLHNDIDSDGEERDVRDEDGGESVVAGGKACLEKVLMRLPERYTLLPLMGERHVNPQWLLEELRKITGLSAH